MKSKLEMQADKILMKDSARRCVDLGQIEQRRRNAAARDRLRKGKRATKLHSLYLNSPDRFAMTFSEFKKKFTGISTARLTALPDW